MLNTQILIIVLSAIALACAVFTAMYVPARLRSKRLYIEYLWSSAANERSARVEFAQADRRQRILYGLATLGWALTIFGGMLLPDTPKFIITGISTVSYLVTSITMVHLSFKDDELKIQRKVGLPKPGSDAAAKS